MRNNSTMNTIKMIPALPMMAAIRLENMLFNYAHGNDFCRVVGYTGGRWTQRKLNDAYGHAVLPEDMGERVTVLCFGNQSTVETDRASAGAALTVLVLNHLCWNAPECQQALFSVIWEDMQEAVRNDKALDQAAIWRILD